MCPLVREVDSAIAGGGTAMVVVMKVTASRQRAKNILARDRQKQNDTGKLDWYVG